MLESIKLAWAWLGAQNAALPYLLTTLSCLLGIDLWKHIHPKSWHWAASLTPWAEEVTKAQEIAHNFLLALPQVLGAALFTWLASGGEFWPTLFGAVAGAGAPLSHHVRKAIAAFFTKPPGGGDQKPVGAVERIRFTPPDPVPPDAAIRRWVNPASRVVVYTLALVLSFQVGVACSPSALAAQQTALNAVVTVSNDGVLPVLEKAFTDALVSAAEAAPDQESGTVAVALATQKWAPVWASYNAYAAAINAWQVAIDTEGDVLATALAARSAFCQLRVLAAELKLRLPDMPAGAGCGS
jgi:hypothetical protein